MLSILYNVLLSRSNLLFIASIFTSVVVGVLCFVVCVEEGGALWDNPDSSICDCECGPSLTVVKAPPGYRYRTGRITSRVDRYLNHDCPTVPDLPLYTLLSYGSSLILYTIMAELILDMLPIYMYMCVIFHFNQPRFVMF